MIVYSEHLRAIGSTRKSPCDCLIQFSVQVEPIRTMLRNTLNDYALNIPYENDTYRVERDEEGDRWLVLALSALEKDLWVPVAEIVENEENMPILSLVRIRPQYENRRRTCRERAK